MTRLWSTSLLVLCALPWGQALPSPSPTSTTFNQAVTIIPNPAPTKALHRREDLHSVFFDQLDVETTITQHPSRCGYLGTSLYDGIEAITCRSTYDCVWHTANSVAAGMMGCCSPSNYGVCVEFYSTCYDQSKLIASSKIQASLDRYALYCSNSNFPSCVTYSWPEQDVVKFDCDFTGSTEFLYTWATGQIEDNGSLEVLATKEPRTVNDDPFRTGESQSQPSGQYGIEGSQPIGEPTATASPGSDLDNENDLEDSDESKESGSSLSAGTIAGSVVGGVLGVSGFAAAGFMFFLMKKRKRQDNGSLEDVVPDDGTSISTDGSPSTQAVHHSKNLSGPGTVTTDTSGDYESKYNISEVAGSEVPSSPAYEIDGRQYMAELPAHEPRREGA